MIRLLPGLLLGCVEIDLIQPGSLGGAMKVCPYPIALAPVAPDTPTSFRIHLRGRDRLTGMDWQPGPGSRLEIGVQNVGAQDLDINGYWLPVQYWLLDAVPDDTQTPIDDGVLRLFFRENPVVDAWVEIVRGEDLLALQDQQRRVAAGEIPDPCDTTSPLYTEAP